uniref:Uncharacterized protein n=1 Tax=Rhizophora mucronata TaxID=61149 RepID=A0A2P2Q8B4_RHIMU
MQNDRQSCLWPRSLKMCFG